MIEAARQSLIHEGEALKSAISSVAGVTCGDVSISFALDGVDFVLPIVKNGRKAEACEFCYDGRKVYDLRYEEDGEWENDYAPNDTIGELVGLVEAFG